MERLPLLLLLPLTAVQSVFAQTPYFEDVSATLPPNLAGACMDAAAGDADGDGDLDLALAMEFQRNRLLLNDGRGLFSDASGALPAAEHDSEDVAFVDIDGDGDLDLFFVSEDDRKDELYLNDGQGRFTDASERLRVDQVANALAVLDIDGDGAMDLLFGNIGPDNLLLNNGDGTFTDATEARWPQTRDSRTQDLELFDADGDGDLDLAVGNEGQNQLYLNEGGVLREVTATHLPAREDETREIRALDVDGDGDLDLAIANVSFLLPDTAADYLLLNDGNGRFTPSTLPFPEDARSNFTVQALDIDRDGDLDLLLSSTVFPTNQQAIYLQAADAEGNKSLFAIDLFRLEDRDGDGDQDLIAFRDDQEFFFHNENGNFRAADAAAQTALALVPDRLDFDDDGSNELAIWSPLIELQPQEAALYRQNNLQLFDIDDNGSVEVLGLAQSVLPAVGDYLLLLNDGQGAFSRAEPGVYFPASANGNGFDIEVADFNGDGLDDLFFCNRASVGAAPEQSGGLPRLLFGLPR